MRGVMAGLTVRGLPGEILAGLTLLALSAPLNIGYAQIAGLPATAGLYALVVPTVVYAVLASSRHVVASPDAAAAALVFSSLIGLGVGGDNFATMAAAQAIVCGVALLAAAVFRLGFLANFLSHPILTGFVAGLALEVMLSQLRKMLGVPHGEADGFFRELADLVVQLPKASAVSVLLSALAVALLLIGRRFAPQLPAALVVLVLATVATGGLHLERFGVAVLGAVQAGPPQFSFPMLGLREWLSLVPSALALALVTMAEGLLMSRAYGEKYGYPTNSNRDLLAFGAANVAAGVSLSFAVGSSTSRSAAMEQAGSRSQLPSVVLAAGSLLLLLFGTDLLADVPSSVIGAVVAVAVLKLLAVAELRELFTLSRFEFGIALICLLGVLVLGPLQGLAVAFVLSLVNLARRAAAPQVDLVHPTPDPSTGSGASRADSSVLVVRIAGPIFFANGSAVTAEVERLVAGAGDQLRALVLDAEAIGDLDVSGAQAVRRSLAGLSDRRLIIAVARLRPELRVRLDHFGLLDGVRVYATNREAVGALTTKSREAAEES